MQSLFVSSTFRDMNQERDAIRNRIAPELNDLAQYYGQSIHFCDLRWGVNTTEMETNEAFLKVIDVCLDEIDRCKPYMVVLLGDRYGWCPDDELVYRVAQSRQGIQLPRQKTSVTALEILYGALGDQGQLDRTLFYFRQIDGSPPPDYLSESDEDKQRLDALKAQIMERAPGRVRTYRVRWDDTTNAFTSLDGFCDMVTADVQSLMESQWKHAAGLSPYQRDQLEQWEFAQQKETGFAARQAVVDEIIHQLNKKNRLLVLQGPSGCGKSTLISRLAFQLKNSGQAVLPIFCGSTNLCGSALDITKYMVDHLEAALGMPHFADDDHDSPPDNKQWKERLENLCAIWNKRCKKPLTVLIDAIDQLTADTMRDQLQFLPGKVTKKLRIAVSCLDQFRIRKPIPSITIPPADLQDRESIIRALIATTKRNDGVAQPVIDAMLRKQSSESPLYLMLLVQRLDMLSRHDYAQINSQSAVLRLHNVENAEMQSITDHQVRIIENCPESVDQMCVEILTEASNQLGSNMAMLCSELIAVSRFGLRETDLAGIFRQLGLPWNSLLFSRFRKYMSRFFIYRKDGRIDYAHRTFREGFLRRCKSPKDTHAIVLRHLQALNPEDSIRRQEIMYHIMGADDWQAFASHIHRNSSNPEYLACASRNILELSVQDWGQWLLTLIHEHPEKLDPQLLMFLRDRMWTYLSPTQEKLELEQIVLDGLRAHWQRLAKSDPSPKVRKELANCCLRLGDTHRILGGDANLQNALTILEQCRDLWKEWEDSEDLAAIYDSMAKVHLDIEDSVGTLLVSLNTNAEEAAKLFKKSLDIRQRLVQCQQNSYTLGKLADSYETYSATVHHLSITHKEHKANRVLALDMAAKALELRQSLLNKCYNTANLQKLAACYVNLGDIHAFAADRQQAAQAYAQAMTARQELVEQLDDAHAWQELSSVYKKIGVLCDYASWRNLETFLGLVLHMDDKTAKEDQLLAHQMHQKSLEIDERLAGELDTVAALSEYRQSLFNMVTTVKSGLFERIRCIRKYHQVRIELLRRTGSQKYQPTISRNYQDIKTTFATGRKQLGFKFWLLILLAIVAFILMLKITNWITYDFPDLLQELMS